MKCYEVRICLFRYVSSYSKFYVRLDRLSFNKFDTFFSNFNQHDNFYNLLMSSLGENSVTYLGRYLSCQLRIISYTIQGHPKQLFSVKYLFGEANIA